MKTKQKLSQERQLEEYWNKHYKEGNAFKGVVPDQIYSTKMNTSWNQVKNGICDRIMNGLPLARDEYYIAIACCFLMGDRPYMEFFETRWHETDTHMAYCPATDCEDCANKKSKKALEV